MKSNKSWVAIFALLMVVTGLGATAYALLNKSDKEPDTNTTTSVNQDTTTPDVDGATEQVEADLPTIVFTDDGFARSEYRFAEGIAIRVENQSSMDMQFSSDDHPAHRENPELNMPLLGAGESGTVTPPGKGTYGFHDHINDQYTGTLIIE